MRALRDRFGFLFWLNWILWFAGSFVLAAVVWTTLVRAVFGRIEGVELTITWSVGVFGSWLLLVIPFMRKKEEIWKRLNPDQEKAVDAWFKGMGLFIGLLIGSSFFWSVWMKDQLSPGETTSAGWVKAVFGTWLAITIPFLILMYRQAENIFKSAVGRQTYQPAYRTVFMERSSRLLPSHLARKLAAMKPTLPGGHVMTVILKNGVRIPHVFMLHQNEVLGVYDRNELGFKMEDILDLEEIDKDQLPAYEDQRWLRLDGGN